MNPALISLHRQGVFHQPWSTLTSFTSDFGLSLVDYFPLIPKLAVVLVAIHTFINNYPSAIDNHFICSLLDMDSCAVQKKKNFKIQNEFSDRCSKYRIYTLPGGEVGWGKGVVYLTSPRHPKASCILRHGGVQLIFAYSWARPAILAECKGRRGMFLLLLFLHFHSFSFLPCPSLSSPLLSPIPLLPFSGRQLKMTHGGWCVVKPQLNQINHTLPSDKTRTIHRLTDQ